MLESPFLQLWSMKTSNSCSNATCMDVDDPAGLGIDVMLGPRRGVGRIRLQIPSTHRHQTARSGEGRIPVPPAPPPCALGVAGHPEREERGV